LAETGVNI